ncbi:BTAD domain-containing putative transcriptional regulator [Piscinibacter sp. XHJ-5]|uniref:ATP-binding protein n=1 Tax=Piscinibacter sp. XHJ-5 TaxID=3037797 RepID=UPI0024531A79|nr:BTAD domain-containing putative transcriptional regulator [Piscinibacter sp. XHJ-5]
MTWHLRLIGTPALRRGAELVPLPLERRWQIVAMLALRRDWMQRSELATLLWPELARDLASTNLRKALFRLRDTPGSGVVETDGTLLRVAAPTDVDAFDRQVQDQHLGEALAAHRGELLLGFDDDGNEAWSEWLRTQRERWRQRWRAAALQRLEQPLAADEGIALSAAMLEADPLDEAALQAHLRHLAAAGQTARARETYRMFARQLQEELGVQPGSALRSVHDSLHAQASLPAAPAPAADDGYVGRVFEQRRLVELMRRPDCRLLAVVGPGGIGKTRLVRHTLDDVATLFADGAFFVSAEDVDGPAALVAKLVRELDVPRQRMRDETESLEEHLRVRSVLLVLDNFEPIAGAATPLLQQLLDAAPGLKLIVTTRERLALPAQWALPLDGLPCPEPEDMDRLEDFDASRLFIAAARRAEPGLDAAAECAAIVDICRQVDGLPLALELAAAWTRVMRCDAIARELREGTDLFRAANPAFPARQASLEAVFEQSWRLLGERERQALARLSVPRGGFTVEAAKAVASAALPVLGALVDKSLLRKDGPRMSLHPLVQQFAALRLGDGEAFTQARAAHARFFRDLLSDRQTALRGGDPQALRCVDAEFENCRLAVEWLSHHGPTAGLATAAWALADHSEHRAQPQRGLTLLQAALEAPAVAAQPAVRARLLVHAAQQHYRVDRYAQAEALAREALAGAAEADDEDHQMSRLALNVLGSAAMRLGRLAEAAGHYRAMLELGGDHAPTRDRAVTLDHLALVEKRLGHTDEALRLSQESIVLQRRLGDVAVLALGLNNLASLHLARGEFDAANPVLAEALALCERAGLTATQALVLANLCDLAHARGDLDAALRHGRRAREMGEASGQRMLLCWVHASLGSVALQRGDVVTARESIALACGIALALEAPTFKKVAVLALARLLHGTGHAAAAGKVLTLAIAEPGLSPADRDDLRRQSREWHSEPLAAPGGLTLDALLQRVAIDLPDKHEDLVAFPDR